MRRVRAELRWVWRRGLRYPVRIGVVVAALPFIDCAVSAIV